MNQRFPKTEKLKRRSHITSLFTEGKALTSYPLRLIYKPIDEKTHQTGVGVPKRRYKRAVDRNRLKRQMREAYRLNKEHIATTPSHYALLFIYLSNEKKKFDDIQRAMQELLQQLAKV